MPDNDQPLIIEPPQPARACVLWLHGLGADGYDFEPLVPHLGLHLTRDTRFVFPHAPQRPVTVNGGMVMRAWYDIVDPDVTRDVDQEGIHDSVQILRGLMEAQIALGVAPARIVLAGFSQGGAIALHTGLTCAQPPAGILALSTYLAPGNTPDKAGDSGFPIFMAHGDQDPVIPLKHGLQSKQKLEDAGYRVTWRTYPMPHAVCPEEIRDLADWLSGVLA
ncbi:MAG: carboxylesterase [Gammaproteobacteria bacterium]|nr:MAG: carboxylesterase [Gammaproteobacteria bacterium]